MANTANVPIQGMYLLPPGVSLSSNLDVFVDNHPQKPPDHPIWYFHIVVTFPYFHHIGKPLHLHALDSQ